MGLGSLSAADVGVCVAFLLLPGGLASRPGQPFGVTIAARLAAGIGERAYSRYVVLSWGNGLGSWSCLLLTFIGKSGCVTGCGGRFIGTGYEVTGGGAERMAARHAGFVDPVRRAGARAGRGRGLVAENRFVTLVGAGGVGETRLAIEVFGTSGQLRRRNRLD